MIKCFFTGIFVLNIWTVVFGQNTSMLDSIRMAYQNSKDIQERRDLINELLQHYMFANLDSANHYMDLYEQEVLKKPTEEAYFLLLHKRGVLSILAGQLDNAAIYSDSSKKYLSATADPTNYIVHYTTVGILAHYRSNFEEAVKNHLRAAHIADSLGEQKELLRAYNNIAISYSSMSENRKALEYYSDALELVDEKKDPMSFAILKSNVASEHYNLKDYSKAEKLFLELKPFVDSAEIENLQGAILLALGKINLDLGYLEKSESFLLEAYQSKLGLRRLEILDALIELYTKTENRVEAEKIIQEVLTHPELDNNLISKKDISLNLQKYYKQIKNYKKALQFAEQYQELVDSNYQVEKINQAKILEAKYQSTKKEALLAESQLELQKNSNQRNTYIGLLIGFLLLSGFSFWQLINRRKLNESRISLQQERIQNLEKQQKLLAMDFVLQGQEDERKRIAQDLHDGLGGILASARLQMRNIEKEIEKLHELKLFNQAEELIDNACHEVRRIAHDMMPSSLADLGLIATIEDLANKMESQYNMLVTLNLPHSEPELSEIQMVNIYRIIQEALSNTVKYAEASTIQLKLEQAPDRTYLKVADNGKGFDKNDLTFKSGLGIKNIESRVKYLGGEVTLDSGPHGTSYEISIPNE